MAISDHKKFQKNFQIFFFFFKWLYNWLKNQCNSKWALMRVLRLLVQQSCGKVIKFNLLKLRWQPLTLNLLYYTCLYYISTIKPSNVNQHPNYLCAVQQKKTRLSILLKSFNTNLVCCKKTKRIHTSQKCGKRFS